MSRLVPPVVPPGSLARNDQPVLHGERGAVLRPWTGVDTAAVVDAFSDPDIQRWHFRRMDAFEARDWVDAWEPRWRAETDVSWAICADVDAEAAGYIAVRDMTLEFGWGAISYWMRPAFRRRGLAAAATRAVAAWAFDDVGLHRLEIRHSIDNAESCGVATNAGFPHEGTMKSALLHADGWHDVHVHARLGGS